MDRARRGYEDQRASDRAAAHDGIRERAPRMKQHNGPPIVPARSALQAAAGRLIGMCSLIRGRCAMRKRYPAVCGGRDFARTDKIFAQSAANTQRAAGAFAPPRRAGSVCEQRNPADTSWCEARGFAGCRLRQRQPPAAGIMPGSRVPGPRSTGCGVVCGRLRLFQNQSIPPAVFGTVQRLIRPPDESTGRITVAKSRNPRGTRLPPRYHCA